MDFFSSDWAQAALTALLIASGFYAASRRKTEAETALAIVTAAEKVVQLREGDYREMEEELQYALAYGEHIYRGAVRLVKQLKKHNLKPAFLPTLYTNFVDSLKRKEKK